MLTVKDDPLRDGTIRPVVEWHGPVCLGPADEPKPSFEKWFRAYCLEVFGEYKER